MVVTTASANVIGLGYNNVPKEAEAEILKVFRSGQYSPGPKVKEFEEKFARLHKAKHAIFVNSGTDALRLSLLAMKEKYGWQDGDGVAVPAVTFVATVNTVIQANLKPIFVDVSAMDFGMDRNHLNDVFRGGVKVVVPVHLFGLSNQMRGQKYPFSILSQARVYGVKVVEDSCETILNPLMGDISCYSTYMAHHLTTGVGGFAITNDAKLRDLIWSYANHGRREPGKFTFDRIGYSCRGTEFEAALGLSQLDSLKERVKQRRKVAEQLLEVLAPFMDRLVLPYFGESDRHTFMMFPIVIRKDEDIKKQALCEHLRKNGIETRDMMPITNQPCYKAIVNQDDFPVAKWINEKGFYMPCHPGMMEDDVAWIGRVFEKYLSKNLQKV